MIILKYLGYVSVVLAIGIYILTYHSTVEHNLVCDGDWYDRQGYSENTPENAYVLITEYRPWIFWGKGDGNVTIQTDDRVPRMYFSWLERIGSGAMASYEMGRFDTPSEGTYRVANGEISFLYANSVFKGDCTSR